MGITSMPLVRKYYRIASFIFVLLFCQSCVLVSQKEGAPVVDSSPYDIRHDDYYVVKRGDTLYTIAWRYGLDYRVLAKANRLRSPDHILVGQRLNLKTDNIAVKKPSWQKPLEKMQTKNLKWGWPVKGPILVHYGGRKPHSNKGVDIGGVLGKPIRAAASGKVVYAGSGLRGYGNLIIIKHNEEYMSAYAHNQMLWVAEGESVQLGQIIAKMGQTDTDQVKCHFEIRQNGQPVDPFTKLPAL